jgi:hypothetical protein
MHNQEIKTGYFVFIEDEISFITLRLKFGGKSLIIQFYGISVFLSTGKRKKRCSDIFLPTLMDTAQ